MSTITTFEQELEEVNVEKTSIPVRRAKKLKTGTDETEPLVAKRKVKVEKDKHVSAADKLMYDAKSKLNYYLKKSPQFQIIESQINILKTEADIYKQNGSIENYEKTKNIIIELSLKRKELKTIFKTGDNSVNDIEKKNEILTKIKNSEEIKTLTKRKNDLQTEIKNTTPSYLVKTIANFRKQLDLKENLGFSTEEVMDFEDEIDLPANKKFERTTKLHQDYYDFCGFVADILDWLPQEIIDSKLSVIKNALENAIPDNTNIKDELKRVNYQIQNEKSAISGATKLTDLMFDIFDFKNDETEGAVPKEILAASNIGLVKAIAYNTCIKNNALHQLDDAVSAGLLGLTVAINSWYDSQKLADSALSFKGFANIYISGAIQREILHLMGQGYASGSMLATAHTLNKQKVEEFVKNNPEFEDLDNEVLKEMLSAYDDSYKTFESVTTETEFSNNVAGEDGDSADVWANVASSDDNTEDLIEGKIEYEKMLQSIKELLNLFENKVEKKTGLVSITNKKLFDKYDKRLFLMYFGLAHKIEKNNPSDSKRLGNPGDFTQEEMAEELVAMYAADGVTKTFSQAAISYRIEQLLIKLKNILDTTPRLKAGFEYFYKYWQSNQSVLDKLSNAREEVGMKLDRDELRDIYDGDEDAMTTQLSDGTKLADAFEISDTNPLDDEIFGMFNEEF